MSPGGGGGAGRVEWQTSGVDLFGGFPGCVFSPFMGGDVFGGFVFSHFMWGLVVVS